MIEFPTHAQLIRAVPLYKVVGIGKLKSERKAAYNSLASSVAEYERMMRGKTLTTSIQNRILGSISQNASTWLIEDMGQHKAHGNAIGDVQKAANAILEKKENACSSSNAAWYQWRWAWNQAVEAAAKNFSHEGFQLYDAVQKWIHQMHCNRAGAWYILMNYIRCDDLDTEPDVGMNEGGLDPAVVLGKPYATVNISSHKYQQMQMGVRRAHSTMFDPAIKETEQTQFQNVSNKSFTAALGRQVAAGVKGPIS